MSGFNKIILIGNLVRKPELEKAGGKKVPVCNNSLGINNKYQNKEGEWKEEVDFIDIVFWKKDAENVCRYLKKGSPILVEGRINQNSWKNEAGETRNKIRVIVTEFKFISLPKDKDKVKYNYEKKKVQEEKDSYNNNPQIPFE